MASQGAPGRQGGPEGQFRPAFNQEELRVLRECNRESFYYRSVPFAAALSGAAFLAMRKGMLRPSDRFGYAPKMFGSAVLGYFLGKISYQEACAEKLMRLPNSPIGEALRKRKNWSYGVASSGGDGGGAAAAAAYDEMVSAEAGFSVNPTHTEVRSQSQDDLRREVDLTEGLDDYHRVTESLSPYTDPSAPPSSLPPSSSYSELRRQNREDYVTRMAEKYRRPAPDQQLDTSPLPPLSPPSPAAPLHPTPTRKNQYGDDVYE